MKTLIKITRKLKLRGELSINNVESELSDKIAYNTAIKDINDKSGTHL